MSVKDFIGEKIQNDIDNDSNVSAIVIFVLVLLFPIMTILAAKRIVENTLDLTEYVIFVFMGGLSAVVWSVITWLAGWSLIPIYLCLIQSLVVLLVLVYYDYHGWADKKTRQP